MSDPVRPPADPAAKPPGKRATAVHIDADEVHVASDVEVPEGHEIVEPPTAATPAVSRPSTDVRDAVVATELETTLRTEGQRIVSMLWETTQKNIALMTVGGAVLLAVIVVLFGRWLGLGEDIRIAAFMFVAGAANLVIGFYYGRTNHQRVGGPGGDYAGTR